jgi:hypothetical protein
MALALSACGSGSGPIAASQTGSGPGPGTVKFAACMRSHGVSQFPDPGASAGGGSGDSQISILGSQVPSSINIHEPSFQAALKTCMTQFNATHPRPPVSAAQKAALLKFAQCMRTHGVPSFADPKFPTGGGIEIQAPPAVGADSPSFQHAQQVCGNP